MPQANAGLRTSDRRPEKSGCIGGAVAVCAFLGLSDGSAFLRRKIRNPYLQRACLQALQSAFSLAFAVCDHGGCAQGPSDSCASSGVKCYAVLADDAEY